MKKNPPPQKKKQQKKKTHQRTEKQNLYITIEVTLATVQRYRSFMTVVDCSYHESGNYLCHVNFCKRKKKRKIENVMMHRNRCSGVSLASRLAHSEQFSKNADSAHANEDINKNKNCLICGIWHLLHARHIK